MAEDGGAIHVEVKCLSQEASVRIVVEDEGPGIDDTLRGQIFEPFFTTKDIGKGTGIGLSVADRVVHEHGGTLALLEKVEGRGARFEVLLPVSGIAPAEIQEAVPGIPRILAMDDNPLILESIGVKLRARGMDVVACPDAETALAAFEEGLFDTLVTDHMLPGMDGLELAGILCARDARLHVLVISGNLRGGEARFEPGWQYLAKPFTTDQLVQALNRVRMGERTGAPPGGLARR